MTHTLATLSALAPRDLDAVAAEVVRQWIRLTIIEGRPRYGLVGMVGVPPNIECHHFRKDPCSHHCKVPKFSGDLNAAHSLVPLVLADYEEFTTRISSGDGEDWEVVFWMSNGKNTVVCHNSLATAITICCVLAKQQSATPTPGAEPVNVNKENEMRCSVCEVTKEINAEIHDELVNLVRATNACEGCAIVIDMQQFDSIPLVVKLDRFRLELIEAKRMIFRGQFRMECTFICYATGENP